MFLLTLQVYLEQKDSFEYHFLSFIFYFIKVNFSKEQYSNYSFFL